MVASHKDPYPVSLSLYDSRTLERWSIAYIEAFDDDYAYGCVDSDGEERVVFHSEIDSAVQPALIRSSQADAVEKDPAVAIMLRELFAEELNEEK